MEAITAIPFTLNLPALQKRAHVRPGTEDAEQLAELAARVSALGQPKALYKESFIEARGADWVRIDGITFTSQALRYNLDKAERVFPFVATCGHEVDSISLPPGDILQPFWLDVLKTFLLEAARLHLEAELKSRYRLEKSSSMHPGSADVNVWPIEQQRELFALLGGVTPYIGVTLTESCLMSPNKSVSGIRFLAEADFRSCQVCRRQNCPSRAAPFDAQLWQHIQSAVK